MNISFNVHVLCSSDRARQLFNMDVCACHCVEGDTTLVLFSKKGIKEGGIHNIKLGDFQLAIIRAVYDLQPVDHPKAADRNVIK